MAKMRKVTVVHGYGAFVGANHVTFEETTGTSQEKTVKTQTIAFKKSIIAAGSLAIEMDADAVDIGKTIHPHPTLGESIGMAAKVAHGICTDLPPVRKWPAGRSLHARCHVPH